MKYNFTIRLKLSANIRYKYSMNMPVRLKVNTSRRFKQSGNTTRYKSHVTKYANE